MSSSRSLILLQFPPVILIFLYQKISEIPTMTKQSITIAIILFVLITLLSFYGAHFHPWIELNQCLENPEEHNGQIVTHFREPTIGNIYSDGFQLLQHHGPSIRVYSDTTGLVTGEYIGLKGIFHKKGYIEAISLHVAKNRRYKIWLSVLPVLLIVGLLIKYYRFDFKKFQIEPKILK